MTHRLVAPTEASAAHAAATDGLREILGPVDAPAVFSPAVDG